MPEGPRILLITGEPSGEQAAIPLVEALRREIPGCSVMAVGSTGLRKAGAEILFDNRELAVMGFGEVLGRLPALLRRRASLKRLLRSGKVDLFIPVDAPGFNLHLARFARAAGVPVLYFIAPQVWAWGAGRVKAMARDLDALAVILPFEEDWFAERGLSARYVGHPLAACYTQDAPEVAEPPRIGLLPGSRMQEIRRLLPPMLEAARLLSVRRPELGFLLLESPGVSEDTYNSWLGESKLPLKRVRGNAAASLPGLAGAWVTSGTATLETALAGVPMIVAYRTGALSYHIARWLVKVPSISLVNLVAGETLVPEMIQGRVRPDAMAEAMDRLLGDETARETQRIGFREIRRRLGEGEPGTAVAAMAREILERR